MPAVRGARQACAAGRRLPLRADHQQEGRAGRVRVRVAEPALRVRDRGLVRPSSLMHVSVAGTDAPRPTGPSASSRSWSSPRCARTSTLAKRTLTSFLPSQVFRQDHPNFIATLEKFRRGVCDQACIDFLDSCGSELGQGGSIKIQVRPPSLLLLRLFLRLTTTCPAADQPVSASPRRRGGEPSRVRQAQGDGLLVQGARRRQGPVRRGGHQGAGASLALSRST